MTKYFLMGLDAVTIFERDGVDALLDCKDNYAIITIDEDKDSLRDIMRKVVGWDGFVELMSEDITAIKYAKNQREWRDFFSRLDPDNNMTDGEMLDYIATFYRVPEFIHANEQ